MFNKTIKLLKITLAGAVLFGIGVIPSISYAASPYVDTNSATSITSRSATFNGSVKNNPTNVWFEYGGSLNLTNFLSINAYRTGSGQNGKWTADILGLYPNTVYYFRAVAENADGRAYGKIYSFTTNRYFESGAISHPQSLTAATEPASAIGSDEAQFNSLILNSESNDTNTWFEWGPTVNLGNRTEIISVGIMPSVRHINRLTGLSPGTTYYFRAVAENASWRNLGHILSFTTSGVAQNTQPSTIAKASVPNKINTAQNSAVAAKKANTAEAKPVRLSSGLEAGAIGSNPFLPTTIFGWLILIILALVLVLLSKHLFLSFSSKKPE